MLTFITILTISVIVIVKDKNTQNFKAIFFTLLLPFLIFLIWYLQVLNGSVSFFISDENYYIFEAVSNNYSMSDDRYLWILLNDIIINYDIYLEGLPLKLINIPIFSMLIMTLIKLFKNNKLLYITVLLPYMTYQSIFNMRDMLILFIISAAIYFYSKKTILNIAVSLFSVFLLLYLRPLFAILTIVPLVIGVFLDTYKTRFSIHKRIIIMVLALTVTFVLWDELIFQIDRYILRYEYSIATGGYRLDMITSSGFAGYGSLTDFIIAFIRYASTPLPQSIFVRLFTEVTPWGILDDIIRFINQLLYYLTIGYLLIKLRKTYYVIRNLNYSQLILVGLLFVYSIIYSIHLYGVTHQRLKTPFQLIFIILAIIVYYEKRQVKQTSK